LDLFKGYLKYNGIKKSRIVNIQNQATTTSFSGGVRQSSPETMDEFENLKEWDNFLPKKKHPKTTTTNQI